MFHGGDRAQRGISQSHKEKVIKARVSVESAYFCFVLMPDKDDHEILLRSKTFVESEVHTLTRESLALLEHCVTSVPKLGC